ncbi:NDMA-dependent alcohol dehydrogenase [Jatrophihabitans sp.]|uniref:NDMA-dependent alcohol dehydrogenase n=1 Tax=Jatrophihabitans sp. TaxID=1932789 RepID=UPI0030C75EFA
MKSRAAVLWGLKEPWKINEIQVDPPKSGEVLVRWKVAGLCHSDEHLVTGDMVPPAEMLEAMGEAKFFPIIGGHEGAGIVEAVGPDVTDLAVGDHVAASFIPACGKCRYCLTGRGNLCNSGAGTLGGGMITDGTPRHFVDGAPVALLAKVGSFSELSCVSQTSIIKVDKDLPLEAVALVSCGVSTGWGSATERANVRPGDVVVVVGVGGIGINAVQGARAAGAKMVIAIDPVEFKRDKAREFGATHTFASMESALPEVASLTYGEMADKVIMAPGVVYGELMAPAMTLTGKGGTLVVTGVAPMTQTQSSINLFELAMWNKEIKGTLFGSLNPRVDVPRLLDLYRHGVLKLDELVTRRYSLDEINDGYQAMRDGTNIRGVVVYD